VNCNQQLCIELLSVIKFHRETEPTHIRYNINQCTFTLHLYVKLKPKFLLATSHRFVKGRIHRIHNAQASISLDYYVHTIHFRNNRHHIILISELEREL
jgi:hypothetical protein